MTSIINSLKKKAIFLSTITILSISAQGQLSVQKIDSAAKRETKMIAENVVTQLGNAIKPDAYSGSFAKQKKSFIANTQRATTAPEMAKQIDMLTNSIKSNKFRNGISLASLTTRSKNITSKSQVAALLTNLEEALKSDAFLPIWNLQKDLWLREVSNMK